LCGLRAVISRDWLRRQVVGLVNRGVTRGTAPSGSVIHWRWREDSPGEVMPPVDYRDYITIEPGKRGGKPCIRGLRITVYDVLSYLASGMSTDEVLADFPDLTREDILACLAYAADREQQTLIVTP
jgi:uncharacterized protein (DUF433 family)